jgi:hypothetical protein
MNINWVLANNYVPDPMVNLEQLKSFGSFWGGWQTWRACATDNVICNDLDRAQSLVTRRFNERCNFYIPELMYQILNRPAPVKLYGATTSLDLDNQEEIIAMHLASSQSDIVLLLGFDWRNKPKNPDRLLEHSAQNYRSLVKQVIVENDQVQWVLVDHPGDPMKELQGVANLSCDTMEGVSALLSELTASTDTFTD